MFYHNGMIYLKDPFGIGSILDELNIFFFQNCYLKLVPMNFDEEF
jgi:hypothetical protein